MTASAQPDPHAGPASVVAAVVTYGDRAERVIETVAAVLAEGVAAVLVVDNGSQAAAAARLDALAAEEPRVTVHRLERNGGSAQGFSEAIRVGSSLGHRHLLLIDDDHVLLGGSLELAVQTVEGAPHDVPVAVAIPRLADGSHAAVLAGRPVAESYAVGGEFFEFDVRRRLSRRRPSAPTVPPEAPVVVPRTPYGGLLLRTRDVAALGIPRADFVLYCDDYEYTERYALHGGRVLLCPGGGIEDRGLRWGEDDASNIARMIRSRDQFRTYYLYRNCAVIERQRARRTGALGWYWLNATVYSGYVVVQAVRHRSLRFLTTYLRAQGDALRGRMGRRSPLPGDEPTVPPGA